MFLTQPVAEKFTEKEQVLTLSGVTWDDYEALSIPEYNRYLISYLNNEITIMSPSRNHERISEIIGMLIETYCERKDRECFPFGSTRLIEPGKEGKEADTGYAFDVDKDKPDLAVEVIFTSGNINDLTKYKYLKVPEVWIWKNQEIEFYVLENDNYKIVTESLALKGIKSQELITYINRGFSDGMLAIKKDFKTYLGDSSEQSSQ